MANLKPNALTIYNYVKDNSEKNLTAGDIAEALHLNKKSVDGTITAAFCRHKDESGEFVPLMERVVGEIEMPDGTHKPVKFIKMTEAGFNFNPLA
jgi:hypothetical protein